jgi:sterol desaturase/sphingolipid hydroxylase (fatty acid hydroxylase superfamily)
MTWVGKFPNTPTHHAMHHEKINGNFGLYFNFWDRMLKTNHAEYEQRFEAVTARPMDPRHFILSPGDPVAGKGHPARTIARAGTF